MLRRLVPSFLLLQVLLFSAVALPADEQQVQRPSRESPYQIPLRSRQFIPEPGVDPGFRQALEKAPRAELHGLVQLQKPLTAEGNEALEQLGIHLIEYVHGLTYIAAVRREAVLKAQAGEGILRWVGPLRTEDKIEPELRAGKYVPYGLNFDGTLNLLVLFYADVTLE